MAPPFSTTNTTTASLPPPSSSSSSSSIPEQLPTSSDLRLSPSDDPHHPNLQNYTHVGTAMAEDPLKSRDDDFPSDSDMGSVIDDDLDTPSTASTFSDYSDDDDDMDDDVTSPSIDSPSGVLVLVGCKMCLTYFMVQSSAAECPRCGDRRELVRFGG